ncbi:MAG: N-acetylneuraminate synthase family protein [Thermoleophilaceae bacterium]
MSTTTGPAPHCYVIAEIGINHNGDVEIAKRLIDLAADAGCDAVKFQKRTVEIVYPPEVLDSPRESPWGDTQRDQKEALEFGRDEYDEIDRHCRERGIDWFASAWDVPSLEFVESYGPPHHKIASALITNREMLEAVADLGKHTFISTALSEWEDVDNAVEVFRSRNCPFTLMHCIGTYPMEDEEANVGVMLQMAERYDCPVGYSSHEKGLICSMLAAALGATALERHITLDRAMYGSDQAASLERRGIELLVRDVRLLSTVMGDGEKRVTERERPIAEKLRYFESAASRSG